MHLCIIIETNAFFLYVLYSLMVYTCGYRFSLSLSLTICYFYLSLYSAGLNSAKTPGKLRLESICQAK